MKTRISEFLQRPKIAPLWQFFKFGLVGVSNTLISYTIELLCYYVIFSGMENETAKIVLSSVLAFVISVTNSFVLNLIFVFKSNPKGFGETLFTYLKTVLCYSLTGLLLSPLLKMWMESMGIKYYISSLVSLIVAVPLNFLMNKFWAFKTKSKNEPPKE